VSAELVTRAPRPALAGSIVGLTWYAERAPAPVTFRELPCTYVPVIIDLDDGWAVADGRRPERPAERLGSFVAGLCDGPVIVTHGGTARCLQLDLTPLAARRLLGVPMAELANRSVDLGDVVGPAAAELAERIDGAGTPERAFAIVEDAVQARLAAAPAADPGVAWSLGRLGVSGGRAPVGGLAKELGWSHRRLIARFRDAVGMPPKRVGRIVRLERLLARVEAPEAPDWARAAAELGFADQAHLAREVRELTGLTPTALRAERVNSVQDAPPPDTEDGRSPHRREEER
jgi:AraC-like DNA-binding protein